MDDSSTSRQDSKIKFRKERYLRIKERTRVQRAERQSLGLCILCDDKAVKGETRCHRHQIAFSKRRESRKSRNEFARYHKYNARNAPIRKAKYEGKKRIGLCGYSSCRNQAIKGQVYCESCRAKRRKVMEAKRADRTSKGLCIKCGYDPRIGLTELCQKCYLRERSGETFGTRTEWAILEELWNCQEHKCAYTGLPLALGVNASLDHIEPIAKGGWHSIDNLQWVHITINYMKRDLKEVEFLAFVEAIYNCRCKVLKGRYLSAINSVT